jgi:DNA segregation ATPase FtsK/SpoIIIE-like protein
MSEPPLLARQRTLLADLIRAAAERARGEPAVTTGFRAELERIEKEAADAVALAGKRLSEEEADIQAEVRASRSTVQARFERETEVANKEAAVDREVFSGRYASAKDSVQSAHKEAIWAIGAVAEGARSEAEDRLRKSRTQLGNQMDSLVTLHKEARELLEGWRQPVRELEDDARVAAAAQPVQAPRSPEECIAEIEYYLGRLRSLVAPRFLKGPRLGALVTLLFLAQVYPLGWLVVLLGGLKASLVGQVGLGVAASALVTLGVALVTHAALRGVTRSQVRELYGPFCQTLLEADKAREQLLAQFKDEFKTAVRQSKKRHNREMRKAESRYRRKRLSMRHQKEEILPPIEERLLRRLGEFEKQRADGVRAAEEHAAAWLADARGNHAEEMRKIEEGRQKRLQEIRGAHGRNWNALAGAWQNTMNQMRRAVTEIGQTVQQYYPPWNSESWKNWSPPTSLPSVLRFGSYQVQLDKVPHGLTTEERLRAMTPPVFDLPALVAFPGKPSLLIEAGDDGRAQAVATLQAVLLRMLTALPAGKFRCIIIDPVGLGQNFAAFMHLADYDDALVASRIWTEQAHIEHRLADLTAHMENVIQKYLRNVYTDITEYNAQAGEVAEPFRLLVVANFPVGFTAEAVRRLVSIVQSGPRCGVYTLISVDTRQPLPKGFDLSDLRSAGIHLIWQKGRFSWQDPDFEHYPLTLDPPAPDGAANQLLSRIGEAAKGARRVEVPFEFIAPSTEQYWTADSRYGIDVALGRAGATQRQHLQLGKGTSQHVVIAGKTGSGKSTLLHALITNLALLYSPDEAELYLIDFKKGVEFKPYATNSLPHARVIAIESEREFGLSVLQRLDAELRARGERFREAGAQNLADYRQARPTALAPRILLIVDEFQEFFTEDDRIAQEAAQLLDRLVRQGRAFGMHVLLGSQTLGGAYSLARSTIDQMAVRIALQCSEADAGLILADDNSAARLLSRPGEAIYNDANGLVEGNHPFQVVWLDEARREEYLRVFQGLARRRPPRVAVAPVVFEGNAPADISKNQRLRHALASSVRSDGRGALAWLGDALAINDTTAAPFRRQNGSNLLLVGQQEETALGMLATAVIGLSAQGADADGGAARFLVIDGRQAEPPAEGVLARLPKIVPCLVRLAGWREVASVVGEVAAEVERRQKSPDAAAPPVYLVIYGLQRLRDLRRAEDDYSSFMSRPDAAANPSQQLATLLREGPSLGVHTLMWCDNLNNVNRALDRAALREVTMRVVFQMGVADSSNLIDSPAASKLGMHRALFFNEEDGRLEKFRPYGVPPDSWLDEVRDALRRAAGAPAPVAGGV